MTEQRTPRDRPASPAPEGPARTVTFLFSDIEGSTRLLQTLGTRYPDVLLAQRRLLREAFDRFDGTEIDTAGDGFFVSFRTARDAIAAAVAAQRSLAGHDWPEGSPVRVRMGIHTGEPIVTDSGDYVGLDVHRAARICAAAHGGQVLLSQVTRELAFHELPDGVTTTAVGAYRLKDLNEPERLHQLVIAGLPSRFPPPATVDARPNNLPAQTTTLIGREHDAEAVRRLLLRDEVRWVTLTGAAGTGKTRLAIEVATLAMPAFDDGAFFVQLASISNPGLVPSSIAAALGVVENPGRPVLSDIETFLARRRLLLVLDNFEQVAGAAPVIAGLLQKCEFVEVLVTSRAVLHVSPEYEYAVPPLATPAGNGNGATARSLENIAAVRLFVERATAANPGFALNDRNAGAIARICRQLDGLPLAIELAAARTRLFPPHALADRLGRRLEFLKGGSRDRPERHQTLRQALAWSYELLGDTERTALRRLAVFVGGCTLEAAEAVCALDGGSDVIEVVGALLDHSLLRRVTGEEGEPRVAMLDTIREFALECLAADDADLSETRRAHADWYLAMAEDAVQYLTGPRLGEWQRRLGVEHDNLRTALTWAVESDDAQFAMRLAAALWRFWITSGHNREGREWLERILAMPGARERTTLKARALHGLATIVHIISDFGAARPIVEECLSVYREVGDDEGIATVLNTLSWILGGLGDVQAARELSLEALERHTTLGNRRGVALALNNLGYFANELAEYDEAVSTMERSVAVRRDIGDRRGVAYGLTNIAFAEHNRGRYETGDRHIDEALSILRELDDAQLTAWALSHSGRSLLERGLATDAEKVLRESLELWEQVGNKWGIGWTCTLLGNVALDQGRVAEAAGWVDNALKHWRETGMKNGLALGLLTRARVEFSSGDTNAARGSVDESLGVSGGAGDRHGFASGLEVKAEILAASPIREDAAEAARLYGAAAALRTVIGAAAPPRVRPGLDEIGNRLRQTLDTEAFQLALDEGASAPEARGKLS